MPALPSIHRPGALETARTEARLDPQAIRVLRNAVYKRGLPVHEGLRSLPSSTAAAIERRVALDALREVGREDSRDDGATKLVLRTGTGLDLETVILRIRTGRSTACVSSQVGCAVRCVFCATGQMGIARSLATEEILEQVARAGQILAAEGRRLRNVVFMGMGEPMHNRAAVEEAVARLIDPAWFALSPRHVAVSTIGIIDELHRFVERFPSVGLALSLHAVRQDVRERLVPLARHVPLAELRRALHAIDRRRGQPLMVEYLLLDDVNDADSDAEALIEFCRGLRVHVNLIPFNPIEHAAGLRPSKPDRQTGFAAVVKAAGLTVTTRFSLGQDIAAACGQLVQSGGAPVRTGSASAPTPAPR